jgi:hypothetical protein
VKILYIWFSVRGPGVDDDHQLGDISVVPTRHPGFGRELGRRAQKELVLLEITPERESKGG